MGNWGIHNNVRSVKHEQVEKNSCSADQRYCTTIYHGLSRLSNMKPFGKSNFDVFWSSLKIDVDKMKEVQEFERIKLAEKATFLRGIK